MFRHTQTNASDAGAERFEPVRTFQVLTIDDLRKTTQFLGAATILRGMWGLFIFYRNNIWMDAHRVSHRPAIFGFTNPHTLPSVHVSRALVGGRVDRIATSGVEQ